MDHVNSLKLTPAKQPAQDAEDIAVELVAWASARHNILGEGVIVS